MNQQTNQEPATHIFQPGEPECIICNQYRYATVHQQAEQEPTMINGGSTLVLFDVIGLIEYCESLAAMSAPIRVSGAYVKAVARALIASQDALYEASIKIRTVFTNGPPFTGGHDDRLLAMLEAALLPRQAGGE